MSYYYYCFLPLLQVTCCFLPHIPYSISVVLATSTASTPSRSNVQMSPGDWILIDLVFKLYSPEAFALKYFNIQYESIAQFRAMILRLRQSSSTRVLDLKDVVESSTVLDKLIEAGNVEIVEWLLADESNSRELGLTLPMDLSSVLTHQSL